MNRKSFKKELLIKIKSKKEILFGSFSPTLTKEVRSKAWIDIASFARSVHLIPRDKKWTYARDVLWPNIKKSTMAKRDITTKTGKEGMGKLTEIDELVLEILGMESPPFCGLGIKEMTPSKDSASSISRLSNFSAKRSIHHEIGDDNDGLENIDDSPQPVTHQSSHGVKKRKRPTTPQHLKRDDEDQCLSEKDSIIKELYKAKIYKTRLESLDLETKLGLPRSDFTRDLLGNSITRSTTTVLDRPGTSTLMERRLFTEHHSLKDKPSEVNSLKCIKLDSAESFQVEDEKVMESSYNIALLIAKDKKLHTIGESLVKPCLLTACSTVLGEESCNKVAKISLSNDTVKHRVYEMAQDLNRQVIEKLKKSPFFSLQCDETTDISLHSHVLFYCRFIDGKQFKEEILFSQILKTTTKAIDVFYALSNFLAANDLPWKNVVGICSDGAQAMTGCRSGFIKLAKEKNPKIIGSHCIIHRQALACKTLPESLNFILNLAIKIVNCVKSSAMNTRLFEILCQELNSDHQTLIYNTEVRWLSKGNVIGRLLCLKSEIEIFLMSTGKVNLYSKFADEKCIFYLAYLADFFESLNVLNLKLQGQNNILKSYETMKAFLEKIFLWQRRLQSSEPNFSSFSQLSNLLENAENSPLNIKNDLKDLITEHLVSLKDELGKYFPDISSESWQFKLASDPFNIDLDILPAYLQEQTIELKYDTQARVEFRNMAIDDFWMSYLPMYPQVAMEVARLLVQFSSTYLCESGFCTLACIKSKYRAQLDVESDLRCALSQLTPNIKKIIKDKQNHPSH
ncbi:UNVERIFIED_CONTAM: hypothetical protein RMT77_014417 [Armadillidium vulgare]